MFGNLGNSQKIIADVLGDYLNSFVVGLHCGRPFLQRADRLRLRQGPFLRQVGIHTGIALATATPAVLPVVIIYLVVQRQIIRGIAMSGMRR